METTARLSVRQCVRPNGTVLIRIVENSLAPTHFRWAGDVRPIGVLIWERDGSPEFVDFGDGAFSTWDACKDDPRVAEYVAR